MGKYRALKKKREERETIQKAGGGHAIAKALLMPEDTDFTFGHNEQTSYEGGAEIDQRIEEEAKDRCMGRVACQVCKTFHGYCVEITEEKEKYKMLPSGDNTPSTNKRKGGLNWLKLESLTSSPTEAKILMVKYNDEGTYGPRVNLKLAFKGEICFLGLRPNKKDPRYKALTDRFGLDENNWVNERIMLFAEKDEFSEGYNMSLTIPEPQRPTRGARS